MKSTLLHVELAVPTPLDPPEPNPHTWFLQSISAYRDRRVLGFGRPGSTKDPNMGRIAEEIQSRSDGTFVVELGAVLLDRLPSPNGKHEHVLMVSDERGENPKLLSFSNQLTRLRFLRNDDPHHLICPLYRLGEVRAGETVAPVDAHIEYLKTAVTTRYELAGADAEDALSSHLEARILDFIARINRVVAAHLLVATEETGLLTPAYDFGSFDYLYLLVAGADPAKLRVERLGLSLFRTSLVGPDYNASDTETFQAYVARSREPDDVSRVLRSAKSYVEGGVLHLALLQLCIAAELATTRYVHGEYFRRGVSKNKLEKRKAEITFSIMLNIEVMALAPEGDKPDRALLGKIDRIRDLRNDLMHYGKFLSSQNELRDLYEATKQYVRYLESITVSVPSGAPPKPT